MDPLAVLRTIWQHRIVAIPIVVLTALAAVYVYQFAPRSYESSSTFAMINPDIPTELDKVKNPDLNNLNTKNPYLRSSDPSLIVQVLLTRLNDGSTADRLAEKGLSNQYTVSRGVGGLNGFLIDITGEGDTPEKSIATTEALGRMLQDDLYSAQKVNGADDVYLFSSIMVASPDKATEQFSSRLRSLIVVFLCGLVLMLGAVSTAQSFAAAKARRLDTLPGEDRGTKRRGNGSSRVQREKEPSVTPEPSQVGVQPVLKRDDDESRLIVTRQERRLSEVKR